jgi:hypothetical protein
MKRVTVESTRGKAWYEDSVMNSPYRIQPLVEMKTIWHPSGA